MHYRPPILLGSLIIGHALFNLFLNAFEFSSPPTPIWAAATLVGFTIAQPALFAAWAVMGTGRITRRIPWTIVALLVVGAPIGIKKWNLLGASGNRLDLRAILLMVLLFVVSLVLLLVARKLTGWRIVRPSYLANQSQRSNQFGIKYLMGWTAGCAVIFAAGRLLSRMQSDRQAIDIDLATLVTGVGLMALAQFAVFFVPALVLSDRPSVRMVFIAVISWAILTVFATPLVAQNLSVEVAIVQLVCVQTGAAAAGLLTGVVLRIGGYRLVAIGTEQLREIVPSNADTS